MSDFSKFSFEEAMRRAMELPFIAVVDIVAELARGCPSTCAPQKLG